MHNLDSFCRAKKLPFPQEESEKKKWGVNKKVSSAVFRAWTDKQKKVLCVCQMQLNTANKLHPLEHPATQNCSEESTQNIDPTTLKQWSPQKALDKVIPAPDRFHPAAPGPAYVWDSNFQWLPTMSSPSKS